MINLSDLEKDYLHCKHGARKELYKLEFADKYGIKKGDLELISGNISVDSDSDIQKAGTLSFMYNSKVNYLSDRVKIYMGIMIENTLKWWPLGVFLFIKPKKVKDKVNCQIYDETMIPQQAQILTPKLFLAGTTYIEVLSYLLISCGITKISLQPTTLTLPADLIMDDSKNKLGWFNYIADQINYNKLSVDNEGWFVSNKYIEPSPANVGYIYNQGDMSIISGDVESSMDSWLVANVFKRVVSSSEVGELVSIYTNDNPTNDFSTVKRGFEIIDNKMVDNVASQLELDNLTRKAAFKANQVEQEVIFSTLNMPHHSVNDILELRHDEVSGIFVEKSYTITLKAGALMEHTVERLVRLD